MWSRFVCAEVFAVVLLVAPGGCVKRGAAGGGAVLRIEVPDADADADVFIDGHYVGSARALGDTGLGTLDLAPGVHRVEVRKAGRFPVQRTVSVDEKSPKEIVLQAELLEDPS